MIVFWFVCLILSAEYFFDAEGFYVILVIPFWNVSSFRYKRFRIQKGITKIKWNPSTSKTRFWTWRYPRLKRFHEIYLRDWKLFGKSSKFCFLIRKTLIKLIPVYFLKSLVFDVEGFHVILLRWIQRGIGKITYNASASKTRFWR